MQRMMKTMVMTILAAACCVVSVSGQSESEITGRHLMANQLAIFTQIELASSEARPADETDEQGARQEHVIRARVTLDMALQLVDDDPQLWQMRAELAQVEGDDPAMIAALKRYCQLVTDDDAAQLKLITAMVNQKQTVPQRLAAIRPFLDARRAAAFTPALRSRLASYAAELAHDAGDQKAFAAYLKQAIELDETNVQAFLMAIDFAKAGGRRPVQIGALLTSAIEADPMNYELRVELGSLLLAMGQYNLAAQQIGFALELATTRPDPSVMYDMLLAVAADGRSEEALTIIRQLEQAKIKAAEMQAMMIARENAQEGEELVLPEIEPEPLGMEFQLLRLAILQTMNQKQGADDAYAPIKKALDAAAAQGDAAAAEHGLRLSLIVNRDLPDQAAFQATLDQYQGTEVSRTLFEGLYALRTGNLEQARQLLESIQAVEPFAAYGLALSCLDDNPEQSQQYLQQVYLAVPQKLVGMMATRLSREKFDGVRPTDEGKMLQKIVNRWPSSLRRPNLEDRRWSRIDVKVMPEQYDYLEPIYATIKLRNVSTRPMALRDGGALPTQLFAMVSADIMPQPMLTVVDVARRLRLEPQQAIEMKARLDRGHLGQLLSHMPIDRLNLEIKSIYGPVQNNYGLFVPGPIGDIDAQRLIERRGVYFSPESVSQWVDELPQSSELGRYQKLSRLCGVLSHLHRNTEETELVAKVSKAVNRHFEEADSIERAWMLGFVTRDVQDYKLFNTIHQVASRTDDKLVRIMYIISQVNDPMSSVLTAGMRSDDPDVVAFSRASMTRIEQQVAAAKAAQEAAEAQEMDK